MLPIMAEEMKKISGCLRRHLHLPKTRDGGTSATDTSLSDRVPIYDEHQLFMDQLAGRYSESNINLSDPLNSSGLTQAKAASLLEQNGKNALAPPKQVSNLTLIWRQVSNMFVQLLLWAGILSLITYFLDQTQPSNLYGALVLFLVSILMCIFSFLEEKKALTVIRGFHNLLPQVANVIRDAQESTIAAENLVVGDIVRLNSGVKVPADLRLLTCNSLKLETSALTGESKAIDYTSDPADSGVFDAHNVAFNGSFCLDGDGLGLVIRTGDKTMIGQIAKLTNQQKDHKTLLQIEIARFVRFIAFLSVGMGAVIFAIAIGIEAATGPKLTAAKVLSLFINGFLTILVANIPEGLPATVTSQLTIIARRMAKLNVYTKRLDIVETLGAATVIASDKTGTLTTNTMTVTDLWFNNQFSAGAPEAKTRSVVKKMNKGEVHTYLDLLDFPLPELLTAMVVCNKAAIEVDSAMKIVSSPPKLTTQKSLEEGTQRVMLQRSPSALARFTIRGSPSEAALLRFCEQMFSTSEIREEHDIVFEIPFNSSRKWHLVITKKSSVSAKRQNDLAHFTLTMKGAPEILIKLCTEWASESGFQLIDSDFTQDFEDAYMHFGKEGRRLIAFCSKVFEAPAGTKFDSQEMNFPTEGLCFLGMAAIIDPPRAETKHAILSCRAAGIKVFMVTGDHPVTAVAIAKQIALIAPYDVMRAVHREETEIVVQNPEFDDESEEDHVIHGDELATLSDAQWDKIIARKSMVFARTTPEQKLLIVEQLQKRGEVVAVTGDGVNDAPALKRADIGVAMGKAGSDVAKQAADIVLMDDNFASIVKGIEQGRLMFANIRKTIAYTMSHMPPEIFLTIMNLIFGFPVALTSLQVLSIDLGSELAPAISLAYETPESDIMSEPPRKKTARLVNKRLLLYSYIFMGFLFSITAWAAYAAIYIYHGIPVNKLFFSTAYWTDKAEPFCVLDHPANSSFSPGCFNATEQVTIVAQSCGASQVAIVGCQFFHIWMCKTRRISLFQHGITNLSTIVAVIVEICLVAVFIYVPGVNFVLGVSPPTGYVYLAPLILGVLIWGFNEWRKFHIRNWPRTILAKVLKW